MDMVILNNMISQLDMEMNRLSCTNLSASLLDQRERQREMENLIKARANVLNMVGSGSGIVEEIDIQETVKAPVKKEPARGVIRETAEDLRPKKR